MKILFILPSDSIYKYKGAIKRTITYAPLTFTTLAALIPGELEAEVEIIDEGVQKPDYENKMYDIVGITCVVSSAPRAYELAGYWRKRGSHVVLGGAHPTLMPEEAARHCDTLVKGFAEETFPQLLRDFQKGEIKKVYEQDKECPLSSPNPRRDLTAKKLYVSVPTVIANRGCRNDCEFCAIPRMWGRKNFTRPVAEVIDEIKRLNSKSVIFLDPSPISNKEYAKEFYRALIPLKIRWAGLATINITKDMELFDLIVQSGCIATLIGFESLSQESMALSRKGFNRVEDYKRVIETLHRNGISILGTFVLGLDGDTKESLNRMPELIAELGVDLPRFAVLTPYPGTDTFNKLKRDNRLITEDWSKYDSEQVVFKPKNMTANELQQIFYGVYEKTYSLKHVVRRTIRSKRKIMSGIFNFGLRKLVYNMTRYTIGE
ncbi:MAG: B12-binding domain-containing radical SAM protein [bacterium]|nr:B12-binding domain-containing radical SAM protein [bacterium]